jgi:hypothetical protein
MLLGISGNATRLFHKQRSAFVFRPQRECLVVQTDFLRAGLVYEQQERLMAKRSIKILVFAVFLAFLFSTCITGIVSAAEEETLMGYVVKQGKGFVIEADEGDYIVKGKDVSKLVGKLVEVTGIITESNKGDVIEVKSIQPIEETQPD